MDTTKFVEAIGKSELPFVYGSGKLNDENCQKALKKVSGEGTVLGVITANALIGLDVLTVTEKGIWFSLSSGSTGEMGIPKTKGAFSFDSFILHDVKVKKGLLPKFDVEFNMFDIQKDKSFTFKFGLSEDNLDFEEPMNKELEDLFKTLTEELQPVQNIKTSQAGTETSAEASGEKVIVYKDNFIIFVSLVLIVIAPFFSIFAISQDGNAFLTIIACIIVMLALIHYRKYLQGGIIIDLNKRVISFTKVIPFLFFKPFPRNDISFDEITGIEATDQISFDRNARGELSHTVSGDLKVTRTYKFIIHGTFGSKTMSFRNQEKRDQFYSILATYGNFSDKTGE